MKKETFFKERVSPVLFMTFLTVVCISLISYIHLSTRDLVSLNESLFLKKAVLTAADIPLPSDNTEIAGVYEQRVNEVLSRDGETYFQILSSGGGTAGFVILQKGAGLWGEIDAAIGYKNDLATMTGIEFIRQNETPGLGARIMETWFKRQFAGKMGPFTMVPEGTADEINEFDAITGASRTSGAVLRIVNSGMETVRNIVKK